MSWQNDLCSQPVKLRFLGMTNVSELSWNMSMERNILAFTGLSAFVNSNKGGWNQSIV